LLNGQQKDIRTSAGKKFFFECCLPVSMVLAFKLGVLSDGYIELPGFL
jgi:hypothetical protein